MSDPILFALTRPVLADLLAPEAAARLPAIARLLDATVDAVVLGADIVLGAPDGAGIDPTIAAITLASVTRRVGLVVAATPQRDHPYNLARRLATLDHASGGRAGVWLATHDPSAPPGSPWTNADRDAAALDAAIVLRELWRSFPADAIVGDRESGVFAESHRIVAIDHRGPFDVTGPLQVPTSPQIWPPILAWPDTPLSPVADVIVTPGTLRHPNTLDELERALAALPTAVAGGESLRARLGLARATPPSGGRAAFARPKEEQHV